MEWDECQQLLLQGLDCGQVVATAFAEEMNMDIEEAQQLASAFGGGMYCGETCGAVCGAMLALGCHYGFHMPFVKADKAPVKDKTREFIQRFKDKHGSIVCREILGYDCSTHDGMAAIIEKGLMQSICPHCAYDAIELVEELFDED